MPSISKLCHKCKGVAIPDKAGDGYTCTACGTKQEL